MGAVPGLRPSRRKRQLSDERVASMVIDYLVIRHEGGMPGCSAYDITKNAPKLSTTQRQQRIEQILDLLERQKMVQCAHYEKASYYTITEQGLQWYKTIAKAFYEVLDSLYSDPEKEGAERRE
jgi:DNA-binding PadR family transcriptional regulator